MCQETRVRDCACAILFTNGKAVMKTTRLELQNAAGPLQLCAGQMAGCEAAVHAMNTIFADDNTEATIFVDASNAFNSLNRKVTLLNSISVCPPSPSSH